MSQEYIEIGSTPTDEDCAQVGNDNYVTQSSKECRAFISQLRRQFGNEPEGARLAIKLFQHDFGSYKEVVCFYDIKVLAAVEYAYNMEANTPAHWDKEAVEELDIKDWKLRERN